MQLSAHFSLAECTLSSKALSMGIENTPTAEHLQTPRNLAARTEEVRALFNRPVEITSGYRNPLANDAVGGVPTSAQEAGKQAALTGDYF